MLFTSYAFIAFITVLFIVYYLVPGKMQWMLLLAASYLFYFSANPKYLIYISVTTATTYAAGLLIARTAARQDALYELRKDGMGKEERKAFKAAAKARRRRWLIACLLVNFGILAVMKYTNFTIANINFLLGAAGADARLGFMTLVLPMGISFYTFQSMGYIIDVYRGKASVQKNLFRFALFVSFFPQLVQGPISRYDELSATLYGPHPYDSRDVAFGLQRILWGFFKKLVIADRILVAVNTIIHTPDRYQGIYVLAGMLFYTLQLYADFTGGIDITIGIARALGIRIRENFNAPFLATSITDYWRRWHITMGTWFRDYLFYPLSVSKRILSLSRWSRKHLGESLGRRMPVYVTTIIVWFATGVWHGSSWNFAVWGLMNGIVIILSQECEPLYAKFHGRFKVADRRWYTAFAIVRTTLLMSSIRLFDCYRDVPLTFRMFSTIFTRWNAAEIFTVKGWSFGLSAPDWIVIAAGVAVLVLSGVRREKGPFWEQLALRPAAVRYLVFGAMAVAVVLFGAYGAGYDASQFIYNQF